MIETIRPPVRPRSFKTPRTILALIMREMQTTYGRNPGGYLWAVLQPVGAIALLSFVFSVGVSMRTPGLGTNFPLFYATGILPFQLAMTTTNKVARSLKYSSSLLQYPGVQYTDTIIARFLLNLLTHVVVFFIVMSAIHILFDLITIRDVPAIAASLLLAAFFGLGIGVMNCFLFSVSPLWKTFWQILTTPLFLVSCIFFTFEDVPRQFQDYLWYNPYVHLVGLMRRGFYATYEAPYVSTLYVSSLAAGLLVLGLLFLNRFHKSILNR